MEDDNELAQVVYVELRKLANVYLAGERPGHTLQPTELVHEVYLRLSKAGRARDGGWDHRGHYFGAAARAMRQVLVDHARRKAAVKRGAGHERVEGMVTLPDVDRERGLSADEMLSLNRALERLESDYPRKAEIVQLRYFAGLTVEQIAQVLGVTTKTIERDWRFAKAWLRKAIAAEPAPEPAPES